MTATDNAKAKNKFLVGLFLICMCGLMLQIIETRILSVISDYHLAFFAISMAMFGMTGGSLVVYFQQTTFPSERLLENMVWICAAFGLAVVVSALLLISTVMMGNGSTGTFLMALPMVALSWVKLILILAMPYFFAGMAISLALTRSPWPVPLVYGVDLFGAATGCLVVLVVLTLIDAVSALFLVGMFGALAAVFFAAARRAAGHSGPPFLMVARLRIFARPIVLAEIFALLALGNAVIQPYGLKLSMVKGEVETATPNSMIRWNSFSRINVNWIVRGPPQMWGASAAMPAAEIDARHMAIDGSAASWMYRFDGDLSEFEFLRYDITNLAYSIRREGRAAIIGVGGGRDLLSAQLFGFRDVTGVELNPIFIDLLTRALADFNRLATRPGVRLLVDEARSWFARSDERFDLIQMSMTDTWAATGAGAFSLSENGLYTVEGWKTFFNRLTANGVFTVSRWYSVSNINETGRMMSLANATLLAEGIANPRQHLFLAATDSLATLIVSRAPFSAEELATLTATAARLGFAVVVSPQSPIASPVISEIVSARTPEAASAAARRLSDIHHLDLTAPTDDRPFFFNQLLLGDPKSIALALGSSPGVISGNFLAEIALGMIVLLSATLVTLTIIVPSLPSLRQVPPRLAGLATAYFLLIGLAFMLVEVGLIQRISVFLGHPVYGLAIGLFGIIVSTGAGSLLVSRLPLLSPARLSLWVVILGLYLILLPLWFPMFIAKFAAADLAMRAAVSLTAIVPAGILMGFAFPTGMEIVNAIDPRPTPWLWAVNGAAGVLGAGLAVALSIAFSISVTLWLGAACYLLLGPVAVALSWNRGAERPVGAIA
jgi:hypothetical protein